MTHLNKDNKRMEVTDVERAGGRNANEMRSTLIKLGVIGGAQGSCLVQKKNSKVISSMRVEQLPEGSQSRIDIQVKIASFVESNTHLKTQEESLEKVIEQTLLGRVKLEDYVEQAIEVSVFVLEHDGGITENSIMSASLALYDGGIKMDDIVVASSAVKLAGIERPVIDPTEEEEKNKIGSVLIACLPSTNSIAQVYMDGVLEPQHISECLAVAMDSCWKINEIVCKATEAKKQMSMENVQ